MAHRRSATLAAVATVAAGLTGTGAGTTAQAAGSTPGYSLTHVTVNVRIGPNDDQSCKVDADIYKPDHTSRSDPKPAILSTNGFGGSKDDGNETAIGKGFVKAGYVVLTYTGLGFPHSGCKITLDDPVYDGKAGKQMVDVLAGKKAYTNSTTGRTGRIRYVAKNAPGDPRVGMIGGSYGGEVQYAVAEQDPRVDALIPIITWNDLAYSLAPNNTSFAHGVTYRTPGVAKKEWINLFFGEGIVDGIEGAPDDPSRDITSCPNFADEACQSAIRLDSLGYPDAATLALARHASVESYVKRIQAPTLLAQGERDTLFNLQEAVATFRSLRAEGTPTRMIWQSWGHSHSTPAPGELEFGAKSLRDSYEGRRFLNWMDHYVKGDTSAPLGPRWVYFRPWVKYDTSAQHAGTAVDAAYATRRRFSQEPTATLYLTGNDGLTKSAAAVKPGSQSYANAGDVPTSYSETSGVEGSYVNNPPSDTPGTFAAFTSRPLARAADLVGSSRLTVHLDAPLAAQTQATGPAGQLILFAKVYDVAPDGTKTLTNRLIAPTRVTDVTKPVHVTLPGVVHRFAKGHMIQLVIAASDAAYANNHLTQPVTVQVSPTTPSALQMPITGRLRF